MLYDVNGSTVSGAYNLDAISLYQAYDINGNELISHQDRYSTFSVLSDSYGAITGGVTPSTNAVYYPANDVTSVSQMWWYLFGESYGCTLDTNNSYSGSRIANDESWYAGTENSFIGRASNIGNPDLIIVLGGTNDVWNGIPLGNYVYSNWTEADKQTFRGALSYLFDYLINTYNADIIFICNTLALSTDGTSYPAAHEYYVSAHQICDMMNIPIIDVYANSYGNHPTALGMQQIRNKLMQYLGESPSIVEEITAPFNFPITIDWSPVHNEITLSDSLKGNTLYRVDVTVQSYSAADVFVKIQSGGTGVNTVNFVNFTDKAGELTLSKIFETSSYAQGATKIGVSAGSTSSSNQSAVITDIKIYEVSY